MVPIDPLVTGASGVNGLIVKLAEPQLSGWRIGVLLSSKFEVKNRDIEGWVSGQNLTLGDPTVLEEPGGSRLEHISFSSAIDSARHQVLGLTKI